MKRRDFVKTSLSLSAAGLGMVAATPGQRFEPASRPRPGILELEGRKQLFLDDWLIEEANRISRFMYRPRKYPGNPVLQRDRPWEMGDIAGYFRGVQIFGQNVLYDDQERIFKMWYLPWGFRDGSRLWCYAVSQDGYTWEKPELGSYDFQGSKQNNIMANFGDPNYFNVIKDPHDPDPQRRYKALGEQEGPIPNHTGGVAVAFSPDGLHWNPWPGNPVIRHGPNLGDAPTMLGWDPIRKKHVLYPRPGHPLAMEIHGNGVHRHIRTIGYSESDDFIHWTPTRIMLAPDRHDRVDYQYMCFTAGVTAGIYVGLLWMHETHEQVWDIFLMTSRDGFHWSWVDRAVPFLGRGEIGSYDAGYMSPSGPIFHDGKIWIYYGAYSGAHSYRPSKLGSENTISVALATLPEDRWLGLLAGPFQGTILTRPFTFTGSKLMLDIDASLAMEPPKSYRNFDECEARGALVDPSGGSIEGFSLEQSIPLLETGRQELRWRDSQVSRLEGKPVRLRLAMRSAALYSLQFVS